MTTRKTLKPVQGELALDHHARLHAQDQARNAEIQKRVIARLIGGGGAAPGSSSPTVTPGTGGAPVIPDEVVVDMEAFIGYTKWMSINDEPPCQGYWDTRLLASKEERRWYDADRRCWRKARGGTIVPWPGEWRGLKAAWPAGYTYRVPGLRTRLLEE